MSPESHSERLSDKSVHLGRPSRAWSFGQVRRLELIDRYAPLTGQRFLDAGCGVGMYLRHVAKMAGFAAGVDIDPDKVTEARRHVAPVQVASAEALPFADGSFDVVLSHEVLEHVADDRQAVAEALRVLKPGGRLVLFVPNRRYPFETHGCYWRGSYRFGNIPLVNWLPARLRNRLCPHVRAYTARELRRLWAGLNVRVVLLTQIYPGYDRLVSGSPRLGALLRALTHSLERTPLRAFGLSHFAVLEKAR